MVGAPGWKGLGSGSEDVQVGFYLEFHQTFNFVAWSKSIVREKFQIQLRLDDV